MTKTISHPILLRILYLSIFCFSNPYSLIASSARQVPKVTISGTNIPIREVFKKIYQQTGLEVINNLSDTQLDEENKITVNFIKTGISEVMVYLLNDKKELSFFLNEHTIDIFKKPELKKYNASHILKKDTAENRVRISGKIVDNSGNPIPGATILEKKDKRGTISDAAGTFSLSNISKGSTIVVSSIGFESKEIIADEKNSIIQLNTHTNALDEKLVIAYGITTKRLSTGNISSVKAIDIEKQPVGNPLLAVEGRVPGIYIQQATGLPGTGVIVRIQGINSLHSGNDPFYVVDGVPYISQLLPTTNMITGNSGVTTSFGNPLNYLNTSDIESIEVLKDADATAIYGSRAANGAVLITTKKGKSGEIRTNVKFQNGWGTVGHKVNVLNTKEYLEMRHEALKNDGISTPSAFDWDLNGTWDTTRNVDWQKELIGRASKFTDIEANISGGSNTMQFLLGAAYRKEGTVFPGDFSDTKGSLHFNMNGSSKNQKFRVQFSGSYLIDNNKLPMTDLTSLALQLAPVSPLPYNKDGSINWMPSSSGSTTFLNNPMAPLIQKSVNKTTNLLASSILSYEIYPGLFLKTSFGYTSLNVNEIVKSPLSMYTPEDRVYSIRISQFTMNRSNSWIVEPQVEFNHNISKGTLNAVVGGTITQQNSDQTTIAAGGFTNDLVMEDLAAATLMIGSTINSVYKYNALFGRITYNWQNKYILNLNTRRDGSSRFGPQKQFHNFGSIAGAWVFSEEPGCQHVFSFLNFGKLRASYGTTGNDQIGDYQFIDLYQAVTVTGTPYQNTLGLAPQRLTNPYLEWEETKKLQFGLDLGFIDNRILFGINYNKNTSGNQLSTFRLPFITGFSEITKNFPAIIRNTGWEFTLQTTNVKTAHFSWTSNINLTIPKNQLYSYFGIEKSLAFLIGKPLTLSTFFSYGDINDTTGKYQYRDLKGNITLNPSDPTDRYIAVSPDPKFYGGFQNSFSYKGISIDIFFQFTKKYGVDNLTYGISNTYPGLFNFGRGNQTTAVLKRWQNPGDNATRQPFSSDGSKDLSTLSNSNAVWTDQSFIKLRNVSISWELPSNWKKTIHLQNAKIFANAQNVLTFTKYKGFDPESPGLSLPPLRLITIGAQISL
ncbi:TonB-linked SusC/RagA family outer membrane protein [Chitinophaga polysaccharea]|uniref:TonB-linked SusC/RagA family outer membrane protein n=1 Tax=Chitinophaga polysaccharea TaxID=1293035 RepID=A0A561PCC1_9BACT|nr:TonB-linked SusC/RagA family outer membrane protein [Chitinophaga polysaccharea]